MKKRTKVLIVLSIAISIVVLIGVLVGIAMLLVAGLLDEKPFPLSQRTPDSEALTSAMKKLDTFSKNKKGEKQDWSKVLSNFLLNPIQSVTLDKNEVNALIDAGLVQSHTKTSVKNNPEVIIADASFNGKVFLLKISKNIMKDIKRDTPFGHFINISMKFDLKVIDNHLNLRVTSLKVGEFPISERWYKDDLDRQLRILENGDDGKRFLNIVSSLKIENEKIFLKYNAKELIFLLMEKLPNLELFTTQKSIAR